MAAAPMPSAPELDDDTEGPSLAELARVLVRNAKWLIAIPLLAGLAALGATYLIKPLYTARTSFLPPQQQAQGTALSALASLGALGGLAGSVAGARSPIDQYVSLLQSRSVEDRIVDAFDLLTVYEQELRSRARERLEKRVRVTAGRRDGLIGIEVDDHDPDRAAAIANRYVEELRRMAGELALSEAQQRRVFFESQMRQTRDGLARAQAALGASGFGAGALQAEPRAAAERYARLQAEVTAAEVRLQTLRGTLTENAPEVQTQLSRLAALRAQLARTEAPKDAPAGTDYVGRYREYKYQETLFELYARQFELARLDESREGALIQVVDVALPPDRKSYPKRAITAVAATAVSALVVAAWLLIRHAARARPEDTA